MSLKRNIPCALVLALLGLGAAQGQYAPAPGPDPVTTLATPPPGGPAPLTATSGRLSSWLTYDRGCNCCGPIGGNGPIGTELYLRTGVTLPVEGDYFAHTLQPGWMIQGGGRVLFFNPEQSAAWTVDLSLSNMTNHGNSADRAAFLRNIIVPNPVPQGQIGAGFTQIPILGVTVRQLNRTFANVGLGREWFLLGGPGCCGAGGEGGDCGDFWGLTWKAGVDFGGRWGSAKLELNEIRHRSTTIAGIFAGLHTDLERNCGCCTWFVGFRAEWDYTFMDVLQEQNDADLQDVNFLIALGVRY